MYTVKDVTLTTDGTIIHMRPKNELLMRSLTIQRSSALRASSARSIHFVSHAKNLMNLTCSSISRTKEIR